jgi:hypothetical protein
MLKTLVTIFLAFALLPITAHGQTEKPMLAQQSIDAMRSYLASNIQENSRFSEATVDVSDCVLKITAKWQRRRSTIVKTWRVPIGRISHVSRQSMADLQLVLKTNAHVIEFVSLQSDGETSTVWKSVSFIPVRKQFDAKHFDTLVKDAQLTCKN